MLLCVMAMFIGTMHDLQDSSLQRFYPINKQHGFDNILSNLNDKLCIYPISTNKIIYAYLLSNTYRDYVLGLHIHSQEMIFVWVE